MPNREQQLEAALQRIVGEIIENYVGYTLYDSDERFDGPDSSESLYHETMYVLRTLSMDEWMRCTFAKHMDSMFYDHEYFAGYNGYRCWTWIDNQVVYEAKDGDDLPIVYLKRDMGDLKQGTRFSIRGITQFDPKVLAVADDGAEHNIGVRQLTLTKPMEAGV
jgi:hypothetical protein